MPRLTKSRTTSNAIALGFRSGLENTVADQLTALQVPFDYEKHKIAYTQPETQHKYTPDFFITKTGVLIETKGRFLLADRKKHLLIKQQRPDLDIRFVFTRSKTPISKGSKTTYADWCEKHGFMFADKLIPTEWLQ